jgi:hypothetical protein
VYLNIEQGIGDQSQTNVVLEYELQVAAASDQLHAEHAATPVFQRAKGSGLDLLFFFSY